MSCQCCRAIKRLTIWASTWLMVVKHVSRLSSSCCLYHLKSVTTRLTGAKANMLKYLHGACCMSDSKPNDICKGKVKTVNPCKHLSDFMDNTVVDGRQSYAILTDSILTSDMSSYSNPFWIEICVPLNISDEIYSNSKGALIVSGFQSLSGRTHKACDLPYTHAICICSGFIFDTNHVLYN